MPSSAYTKLGTHLIFVVFGQDTKPPSAHSELGTHLSFVTFDQDTKPPSAHSELGTHLSFVVFDLQHGAMYHSWSLSHLLQPLHCP